MIAALAACSGTDPSYVARDPCAALAITTDAATSVQHDGICDALGLWRGRGVTAFELAALSVAPGAPPCPSIAVEFEDASANFHGVYDPASDRVLINRGITDRATLAIVVAHELGHVFGLAHVDADTRRSLMNPGNLLTPPTDEDQRELEALWGTCR